MIGTIQDITARKQAEARLAADLAALTRMHALSGRLVEASELPALFQEIMDTAVALMGAERGTLQLLEGDALRIVAQHGHQPPFLTFFAAAENRASACGAALRQGARIIVPDVEASDLFVGTPSLAVLRQAGVRAIQSTPMVTRAGVLLGILTTQWSVPHAPDEHDLWRLDLLVRQAADLIETAHANAALQRANATLEQRVQERTADLSRLTDQLRALAAELTLAEQRERRRLADVLHDEHQQLLVAAKLRMTLLHRKPDPEVQEVCQEATALLQEVIEHSRSLVRDLSPPLLQTGGLVPALTWLARWIGEQHRLAVEVQADPTVTPATEELTIMLYQAVRELLLNAVKHAQVTAARLIIATEDGQVRIVVEDAGVGFDPAGLRTEGGPTGGFGLFSLQQRLPLLGGRLEIVSAPGQGSRFTLWAPLRPVAASQVALGAEPRRVPAAAPKPGAPRKLRLLLVDDHAVVRQSLARVLNETPDLEVVGEAADGKIAVEMARQHQPDVVLMDVSMPVMNGVEATRAIHNEFPHIRVIGLSMFESAEQAEAMRQAGAEAYLTKSDPVEKLLAALRVARSQNA